MFALLQARLGDLLILAPVVVVLMSLLGWWIAVVELVPASSRPYVGGSQTNSILELTLGYNGLGRLNGEETGSVGGGGGWGSTGLFRLFGSEVGGQVAWLLPAALVLGAAAAWFVRRRPPVLASLVLWGTWLLVSGLTFCFMAGIFHAYYTVALAPASIHVDATFDCSSIDGEIVSADARDSARPLGPQVPVPACDLGAFEVDPGALFAHGFEPQSRTR